MSVCDCPEWPVSMWRLATGDWIEGSELNPGADPFADADRFLRLGCDAWVIRCPNCGRMYAAAASLVD